MYDLMSRYLLKFERVKMASMKEVDVRGKLKSDWKQPILYCLHFLSW